MAVHKRKTAAAAPAGSEPAASKGGSAKKDAAPKQRKEGSKVQSKAGGSQVAAGGGSVSLERKLLAGLALTVALASAIQEWPLYMTYEQDWRKPAVSFGFNFGITSVIALAVGISPPLRALKPRAAAPAAAAAAGAAASAAAAARPGPVLPKSVKRQVIAAFVVILLSLYHAFGIFGPSGALTAAALSAFVYLGLP